jgi:muconolactone delta-isomerase
MRSRRSPHPNDPAGQTEQSGSPAPQGGGSEFLTTFTVTIPAGTPRETVDATTAREAESARELAGQGHLLRLWMLPGEGRALGLWRARDADADDPGVAAAGCLDEGADHAAHPAPQRPGAHQQLTDTGKS